MGDLVHMFGVIEGSGGDSDEPAACCMNQKVRHEAVERPYVELMVVWRGCMSSVIARMPTYYEDPKDVTLPTEKYYYHLYAETNCCSGILLL